MGERVGLETAAVPGRETGWLDTGGSRLHTLVTFLDVELFKNKLKLLFEGTE